MFPLRKTHSEHPAFSVHEYMVIKIEKLSIGETGIYIYAYIYTHTHIYIYI